MSVTLRPLVDVRTARDDEVVHARKLHGQRYLEEGYVVSLNDDGMIDDPYVPRSEYLVAIDPATDEMVGTCRLITSNAHSFPVLDHMYVDPEWYDTLMQTSSTELAEVSALATRHHGLG
ncbi:MAG TPA: GNAT family N-acetyltransferase, partial [Acidimicrobiales bacterium]